MALETGKLESQADLAYHLLEENYILNNVIFGLHAKGARGI